MLDRKILYFMCVVEEKSFSAAAKKLFLSQANLSKQISVLEKELGIELFDRSGYRPTLTNVGEVFYNNCVKITRQINELYDEIKDLQSSKINIGFTGLLENTQIVKAINQFKRSNKEINISFNKYNFDETIKKLLSKKVDISFGIESNFRHYKQIKYDILFNYEICIICSFDHPLAKYSEISIEQIKNEDFIILSKSYGIDYYNDFMETCKLDGFLPKIKKEENSFDALIFDVSTGAGISIVSREVVRPNEVKIIKLINSHHISNYVIAYLENENNPIILNFIKSMKSYFKDYNK